MHLIVEGEKWHAYCKIINKLLKQRSVCIFEAYWSFWLVSWAKITPVSIMFESSFAIFSGDLASICWFSGPYASMNSLIAPIQCPNSPIDSSLTKASASLSKSLVGDRKFWRDMTMLYRAVDTFSTDCDVFRKRSMCNLGASHSIVGNWRSLKISIDCVCRLTFRMICKIFYCVNFSQKSKTSSKVEIAGEFSN